MVYNPYTNPDEYDYEGELAYELTEARSEIRRHHEDFEKIRAILDKWDSADTPEELRWSLRQIRNIVG